MKTSFKTIEGSLSYEDAVKQLSTINKCFERMYEEDIFEYPEMFEKRIESLESILNLFKEYKKQTKEI